MYKEKDNLTDLVEKLPNTETVENSEPSKNQQVVNSDGEIITLGDKASKTVQINIKGKSLELTEDKLKEVAKEMILEKIARKLKKILSIKQI